MTPFQHLSKPRRAAAAAAAISAVTASLGLVSAPAATSAPNSDCPAAFPVADLEAGDAVTGKTVTKGTTPDGFTGEVVGVLENGIGPSVDMILVDLESPTIDRVGIWSGMSGSPVYAADGSLIGAVSYSLGLGPSTIAGVTPAADMLALLDPAAPARVSSNARVRLPRELAQQVAAAADTAPAAAQTMKRLRVPITLSGLGAARLESVAPALNKHGLRVADAPGGPASTESIGITAGGNLAASMAHGTITAAGVGTATVVCGDEVVGFGHPMNFTGPATMSLHGARATHIQDDQTLSGFKVANLGAPIGSVDKDRLAGLHAKKGATPTSFGISSKATYGAEAYTAATQVTVQELMADIGFVNIMAAQDRVFDRWGKGQATATWTIKGLRRNGTPFVFKRSNVYADSYDVSALASLYLAEDVYQIADNPGETVTITSVKSDTKMSDVYETYAVSSVQTVRGGKWVNLSSRRTNALRVGRRIPLRVVMTSRQAEPRTVRADAYVPVRALGRPGILTVVGGDSGGEDSEEFFGLDEFGWEDEESSAPSPAALPALLKEMNAAPDNNEVRRSLRFRGVRLTPANASVDAASERVVRGLRGYRVVGVR